MPGGLVLISTAVFLPLLSQPKLVPATPGVGDFFPEPFLFEGTIFELNRLGLVRIVAAVALVLIFGLGTRKLSLVPSRTQTLLEAPVILVREKVANEILGPTRGRQYAPILTAIFISVFFLNVTGVVPLLNIAASSVVAVPLIFALIAYFVFIAAGIKAQGVGKFFKSQLLPDGVPWPLYIILTPIELLSTFVIRPATLTIRLLANMVAGHLMLALTFFGTHYLLFEASNWLKGAAVLTFTASIVMTLFEIFVAVLQAFIFAILTAVYIKMSVETH